MKNILLFLGILAAFALGGYMSYSFFSPKEEIVETDSFVLLEKVKKVCKLISLEATFEERYTEKNIKPVTLYIPFPTTFTFPKEASILVRGTVLVGYNMEAVSFKVDQPTKTLTISNLPDPEVLAIDHEIKYENLSESFFNEFSKEDYTQLAKNAKAELQKAAIEDKLLEQVRSDGNEMIDIIETLVNSAGWTLVVNEKFDTDQLLQ